jgi:hypothetical protein
MIPYVRRRAMLRGPLGGSRRWTYLWAFLFGVRLVRRLTRSKPELLLSETIGPGQTLLISGIDLEPKVIGGEKRA